MDIITYTKPILRNEYPQKLIIPTSSLFDQMKAVIDLEVLRSKCDTICPETGKLVTYTALDDFVTALHSLHTAPEEVSILANEIASFYKDKYDEDVLSDRIYHFGMMLFHYFLTLGIYSEAGILEYELYDWHYNDMVLVRVL